MAANWTQDRADAERLADELNWRIGQAIDGGKLLYRPGLPEPIPCRTWLAMATYMRDYLERRKGHGGASVPANGPRPPVMPVQRTTLNTQPIPVAQHAPPRVTLLGQGMRRATEADSVLPTGKIL